MSSRCDPSAYTGLRFCHASALHWEDWNEEMHRKYSTVGIDEKRAAVAGVVRLVRVDKVGTEVGPPIDPRAPPRER